VLVGRRVDPGRHGAGRGRVPRREPHRTGSPRSRVRRRDRAAVPLAGILSGGRFLATTVVGASLAVASSEAEISRKFCSAPAREGWGDGDGGRKLARRTRRQATRASANVKKAFLPLSPGGSCAPGAAKRTQGDGLRRNATRLLRQQRKRLDGGRGVGGRADEPRASLGPAVVRSWRGSRWAMLASVARGHRTAPGPKGLEGFSFGSGRHGRRRRRPRSAR